MVNQVKKTLRHPRNKNKDILIELLHKYNYLLVPQRVCDGYTKDGKKYYLDNGTFKEIVGSQTETVTEPEFNADKWIKTNEKFLDRELNNYNKNKNKEQAKRILIEQIQGVGFFNRLNKAEATIVANELIGL